MTKSGLIVDDDQTISDELAILQANVEQLKSIVEADRATLSMVTKAEPLLDLVPAEKHVVAIYTPERCLVVAADFSS